MSALVKKEIRLLLPAWIAAVLLLFIPITVTRVVVDNPADKMEATMALTILCLVIGGVIMGLAGFGREVASRTLSMLLAQPASRREFWRAKTRVLFVSLIPIALFLGLVTRQFIAPAEREGNFIIWFVAVAVTTTGGLWTTLLFRQIIAAFWISIIVPFAILAATMGVKDQSVGEVLATILLLAYSVAGYWFARWQFLRAQDTAWTGGNIALPGIVKWLPWARSTVERKKSHPILALITKELQFQQINFLLAGLLLLLQIAVLIAQRFVKSDEHNMLQLMCEGFWGIWIIMPLLVGSSAVAEERKLGMVETQFCLPVSRAWQFGLKAVVTLICGTLLGALLPVVLALNHQFKPGSIDYGFIAGWSLASACLALIAFYASTLTNQLLQAFGLAIGIILAGFFFGNLLTGSIGSGDGEFSLLGFNLWRGPLVLITGAGVMLIASILLSWRRLRWMWLSLLALAVLSVLCLKSQPLAGLIPLSKSEVFGIRIAVIAGLALALTPVLLGLTLAARNARHVAVSSSLWWRNLRIWLGCLLVTGIINTLVYHRAWELLMRFEPPAGPARLSSRVQPAFAGLWPPTPNFVLLPDGRLCAYLGYKESPLTVTNTSPNKEPIWLTVESPRVEFFGGSDWISVAATGREVVGVKSDGSLWSANRYEWVDKSGNTIILPTGAPGQKDLSRHSAEIKFVQIGGVGVWKAVASSWNHCVALKRDGTIWGWGHNQNGQLGTGPSNITNSPVQLGDESDWIAAFATPGHTFAVNRAGEIWKWGKFAKDYWGRNLESGPVKLDVKSPGVRSIVSHNNCDLILDTEGKLWGLGQIPVALTGGRRSPEPIYAEARRLPGDNWTAVSLDWQGLTGLKADGTIWFQDWERTGRYRQEPFTQLGQRNDWIAIAQEWSANLALAKDGTICRFGKAWSSDLQLLAPTRRVTWTLDVLAAAK